MRDLISILLFFFVLSFTAYGQISYGGHPSFSNQSVKKSAAQSIVKMPLIDEAALRKEDEEESAKDVPMRFAYGHKVNLNPENSGEWFTNENGDTYWILRIESTGAISINCTFSKFYIPEGAELFLYNPDKTDIRGAFTSANNKKSGKLGTAPISGDQIVIEYRQPAGIKEKPELTLTTVAHDYRDLKFIAKGFSDSQECNKNVVCDAGNPWRDQIRSVVMIIVSGGTGICSGTLINNSNNDGTPYLLTANHCVDKAKKEIAEEAVREWVFKFNYESANCEISTDSSLNQSISGSELLATGKDSDYLLLKISATPPDAYNVYYAGWTKSTTAATNTIGIHHPMGDVKKISFDYDTPSVGSYIARPANFHWEVNDWDDGTTENGSSGSALFDQNKRIIGQLHGGLATCSNNKSDLYGRFDISFPKLRKWLDPSGSLEFIDGYDPQNPTGSVCIDVLFSLAFDKYPNETSWQIEQEDGTIVANSNEYTNKKKQTKISRNLCLEEGCYKITFNDLYGDGLCCGYDTGSYMLKDKVGSLASGAAFGDIEVKNFCVGANRVVAPISNSKNGDRLDKSLNKLKIFPNPARSSITIDYGIKGGSELVVKVIDVMGKIIKNEVFLNENSLKSVDIDVSSLPVGSYFLNVTENSSSVTKKFMVVN